MTATLRVYGDTKRFRAKLRQRVRAGQDLLLRLEGARATIDSHNLSDEQLRSRRGFLHGPIIAETLVPLGESVGRWHRSNRTVVKEYLGPASDGSYSPHLDGVRLSRLAYDDLVQLDEAIRAAIAQLESLERRLPATRPSLAVPISVLGLDELRSSGLLDAEIIDDFEQRISGLSNRRKWRGAIGAAKELVEALHKAVLTELAAQPGPPPKDDFVKLGKRARAALQDELDRQGLPAAGVDRAIRLDQGLTSVLNSLTELRNAEGQGHGRARVNPGLSLRHVELATHSAVIYCRYIVSTMNDVGRLP